MGDDVGGRVLSDDDRVALRAFARWLERVPPAVEAELRATAGRVLSDAGIPWPPPEHFAKVEVRSAALARGEWGPYVRELTAVGRLFAEAGTGAGAWFEVLAVYHHAIARDPAATRALYEGATLYSSIVLHVIGDALARRQRELLQAAHEETELYAELVRQSPNPTIILEWRRPPDRASMVLIAANPGSRKVAPGMLDSLHAPLSDQYPHWPAMELCDRVVETIETGTRTTHLLHTKAGGTFDVTIFLIRERTVALVYHDVAERERHLAEVQAANSSLDAFAYVASHDLKAPLRDISNLATWIDEDAGDALAAASRKHLGQLRDRATRMDKLLDDLLAYSRAGRIRVADEDTSVRAVVEDAVALAGSRPGFEIKPPPTDLPLRTPRTPLVHVLRNLVDNALKHHDRDRGTISIEVGLAPGAVRFTVADDGPGIPAEFRERVFQPFTTLKPRDRVEGSGMGLAIVKKLIESHGGRIEIEPGEGRGTRMTFLWPRTASHAGGPR